MAVGLSPDEEVLNEQNEDHVPEPEQNKNVRGNDLVRDEREIVLPLRFIGKRPVCKMKSAHVVIFKRSRIDKLRVRVRDEV